jgi:hypothetical protein
MALRFAIERWIDPNKDGVYSGDTRCHFLTPHSALLEGEAEGLNVVNLLARVHHIPGQDGQLYPTVANLDAFSGEKCSLGRERHLVAVNTLNTHPVLGRLGLLNCHRIVHPLTFGGLDAADDWSFSDWANRCHRKNGLVIWCDAFRQDEGLPGGEACVALILGQVNAVELDAAASARLFLPGGRQRQGQ